MAGSENKTELTRAEQKKMTRRKLIDTTIGIIAADPTIHFHFLPNGPTQ